MKVITTISLEKDLYDLIKAKSINLSALIQKTLLREFNLVDRALAEELQIARDKNLKDFVEHTLSSVVNNENALRIWSKSTGRTIEELLQLKKAMGVKQ